MDTMEAPEQSGHKHHGIGLSTALGLGLLALILASVVWALFLRSDSSSESPSTTTRPWHMEATKERCINTTPKSIGYHDPDTGKLVPGKICSSNYPDFMGWVYVKVED